MNLVELLKVVILSIVEGITEWLPISSTGHMLLVDQFLKINMSEAFKDMFFMVIQLGAIMAVVVIFWDKMFPFDFKNKPVIKKEIFSMWFKVVAACIPGAVAVFLFDDYVTAHFETPTVIASMLILYGVIFILVENWNKGRKPVINVLDDITYKTALLIGLFQVLSIVPGTSRSGTTIIGALVIGVSRTAAAEFTFFLAVPAMLGMSAIKLIKFGIHYTTAEMLTLGVGMLVAFAVSIIVIKFLMKYIKKHDFKVFGWYRIILGAIVIAYFSMVHI
ncbi:undecaprenyl-diphosphate phosphatase [Fusibacter ferrireducens]|uniref:Undecaprenyl-diphosphatase n=1 Tax=Fusibacter ferrireducens TaxID=2785058 RepID=A0ABR9ZMY1_9FIRM|nr:undecaprenyl-diphosphate phosphatase [Fusibacter ferrireducens]MBF4691820.1 undecaprenyl-diphosphate phosphatase [Fusibacter ferrireducens]